MNDTSWHHLHKQHVLYDAYLCCLVTCLCCRGTNTICRYIKQTRHVRITYTHQTYDTVFSKAYKLGTCSCSHTPQTCTCALYIPSLDFVFFLAFPLLFGLTASMAGDTLCVELKRTTDRRGNTRVSLWAWLCALVVKGSIGGFGRGCSAGSALPRLQTNRKSYTEADYVQRQLEVITWRHDAHSKLLAKSALFRNWM